MKILIAGSMSVTDFDLSPYILPETELIISGGAKGIDTLAEIYADIHGISKLVIRPRYNLYGKAAPLKRNEVMVDMADRVVVIWDGVSKGSLYTAKYAENKNKDVVLVNLKEEKHL